MSLNVKIHCTWIHYKRKLWVSNENLYKAHTLKMRQPWVRRFIYCCVIYTSFNVTLILLQVVTTVGNASKHDLPKCGSHCVWLECQLSSPPHCNALPYANEIMAHYMLEIFWIIYAVSEGTFWIFMELAT